MSKSLTSQVVNGAPAPAGGSGPLLEVRGLRTHFFTEDGIVKAVDGVDLAVEPAEVFGLVGESGCGKSVTALSILRLVDQPGRIVDGQIRFRGTLLLKLAEKEMMALRGRSISMIFQQPRSSLDPVFTVGAQVAEVLRTHHAGEKRGNWQRSIELLKQVGLPDAEKLARTYPHQLSGGQAQRVMIAMALALSPQLLIADEPTTALDVTIQAQILDLMRELIARSHTSVILITHDLGVIAEMADRVAVMYAGRIVEQTGVETLFATPLHPYTRGLMASMPVLGETKDRLDVIPGTVPNLIDLPPGCRFAPRCQARVEHSLGICSGKEPDLVEIAPGHSVRCWLFLHDQGHRAPLTAAEQ